MLNSWKPSRFNALSKPCFLKEKLKSLELKVWNLKFIFEVIVKQLLQSFWCLYEEFNINTQISISHSIYWIFSFFPPKVLYHLHMKVKNISKKSERSKKKVNTFGLICILTIIEEICLVYKVISLVWADSIWIQPLQFLPVLFPINPNQIEL